jgi:hypothetical protein
MQGCFLLFIKLNAYNRRSTNIGCRLDISGHEHADN